MPPSKARIEVLYLSDRDLLARISELNFQVPTEFAAFDPDIQLQPASIDLRLGPKIWRLKTNHDVDLLGARHMTPLARRDWRETTLQPHEAFRLKAGEFVLAQTLEAFSMPSDCAGKLEGKSSYARLGLGVQLASDFINPSWHGRMPLPLVNHSRAGLILYPGMPICQLALVPISSLPDRVYGDDGLSSKYQGDDGGPSIWWRDRHIQRLVATLRSSNLSIKAQYRVLEFAKHDDLDLALILDRLERHIRKVTYGNIHNVDTMLYDFARKEEREKRLYQLGKALTVGAFTLAIGMAADNIKDHSFGLGTWIITALALVIGIASAWFAFRSPPEFLTTRELQKIQLSFEASTHQNNSQPRQQRRSRSELPPVTVTAEAPSSNLSAVSIPLPPPLTGADSSAGEVSGGA